MGLDDLNKTVDRVMWALLLLTGSLPLLAYKPRASGSRPRLVAVLLLGALCWSYNSGLLIFGRQPFARGAGLAGVALGLVTAFLMSRGDWIRSRRLGSPPPRLLAILAAWSAFALVLFALGAP